MAVINGSNMTLLDWAKSYGPDGGIEPIAEVCSETNEIMDEMVWREGNLPTGMKHNIRTGLPKGTWRQLYGTVQPTKSVIKNVTDTCGMLEAYSEVDYVEAQLNGMSANWRWNEEIGFVEGLGQDVAETVFYGNESADFNKFTGLAPRYNSLDPKKSMTANNVIDAGGTGKNLTSLWLVAWADDTVFGLFPKGLKAGLQVEDLGRQTVRKPDGNMEALVSRFSWNCGLAVKDWRYIVRICNIDLDVVMKYGDKDYNGPDLTKLLAVATNALPSANKGRQSWYCSRNCSSALILAKLFMPRAFNTPEDLNKSKRLPFEYLGVPVRRVDRISNQEARINDAPKIVLD